MRRTRAGGAERRRATTARLERHSSTSRFELKAKRAAGLPDERSTRLSAALLIGVRLCSYC
eukprot:4085514-Prymnesium_polylepis.1